MFLIKCFDLTTVLFEKLKIKIYVEINVRHVRVAIGSNYHYIIYKTFLQIWLSVVKSGYVFLQGVDSYTSTNISVPSKYFYISSNSTTNELWILCSNCNTKKWSSLFLSVGHSSTHSIPAQECFGRCRIESRAFEIVLNWMWDYVIRVPQLLELKTRIFNINSQIMMFVRKGTKRSWAHFVEHRNPDAWTILVLSPVSWFTRDHTDTILCTRHWLRSVSRAPPAYLLVYSAAWFPFSCEIAISKQTQGQGFVHFFAFLHWLLERSRLKYICNLWSMKLALYVILSWVNACRPPISLKKWGRKGAPTWKIQ